MATIAISQRIREIEQVRKTDKDKAVEMFFALVREHPFPVDTIVLHYQFHAEECGAVVFYKKWGEKFFPGIADAVVEIWSEGRMLQEYNDEGLSDLELLIYKKTLIIGAANSLTDEHGTRFPSAAHLTVELLGLSGNPLFRQLLNFYESTDNRPNATFFDFHSFTKRAHIFNKYMSVIEAYKLVQEELVRQKKEKDETGKCEVRPVKSAEEIENELMQKLLHQLIGVVEVDLWDQMRFLECEDEFIEEGKTFRWVNPGHPRDTIEIVIIVSDNHAMAKFVRSVWNESNRSAGKRKSAVIPDVYIQQGSNKSTVVFFSPRLLQKLKLSGVDIKDFVRVLRIVELKKSGLVYDSISGNWLALDGQGRVKLCLSWQDLEAPLDSECCPPWYHSTKGDQLLSRSLTAPDAPETKLSVRQIVSAIALALTPLVNSCQEEECTKGDCPFYKLGFISCRGKRYDKRQEEKMVLPIIQLSSEDLAKEFPNGVKLNIE